MATRPNDNPTALVEPLSPGGGDSGASRKKSDAPKSSSASNDTTENKKQKRSARNNPGGAPSGSHGGGDEVRKKRSKNTTTSSSSAKRSKNTGQPFGRRGDPRMQAAVTLKLSNPQLDATRALRSGGYTYPEGCGDDEKDGDGVALKQRRNQLWRRLRVENKKRQQAAMEGGSPTSTHNRTMSSTASAPSKPVHVRVGVGVLVKDPRNPHKVYAGRRKGSHGAGTLALPGGHLEMYESWEDCAAREVQEEMGVTVRDVRFGHVTNDPMEAEGKHYVTVFMMAELADARAVPTNCEPDKCEGWYSFSWEELRGINDNGDDGGDSDVKMFGPLKHLVEEGPESVIRFLQE